MKKFKHKKLGYVAVSAQPDMYYLITPAIEGVRFQLPKWCIEDSSDWEEMEEPEYPRIIRFKHIDGSEYSLTKTGRFLWSNFSFSLNEMLYNNNCVDTGDYTIDQVQLKTGNIFTVGDKVSYLERMCTIGKFFYDETNVLCFSIVEQIHAPNIHLCTDLKKAPKPIFISEENIPMFIGDTYYACPNAKNRFSFSKDMFIQKDIIRSNNPTENKNFIYFAKEENAEKYKKEYATRFSLNDIRKAAGNLIDEGNLYYFIHNLENV